MRFLYAERVFNGFEFLGKNSVLVLNEKNQFIESVDRSQLDPLKLETLDGIITPGFINTHCHLELSYLKNVIPQNEGLVNFVKTLITKRQDFSTEQMLEAMALADNFMAHMGIAAIGDISNSNISFKTKQKSKLHYHTFIELIGLDPNKQNPILENGLLLLDQLQKNDLEGSLAPHAPYSTSVKLIEAISNYNANHDLPFSIHNQESEEENKFLTGKKSAFHQLYEFLGIDISWFRSNSRSSLHAYYSSLKKNKNILVHNTYTSEQDYQLIPSNAFWCLCPTANLYIENVLPDYHLLLNHTHSICFGTDSLASNSDLNILKEAGIFYSETKNLELTLKALTSNGASALNLQNRFGSLLKEKNAGLNLINTKDENLIFKKVIVASDRFSSLNK